MASERVLTACIACVIASGGDAGRPEAQRRHRDGDRLSQPASGLRERPMADEYELDMAGSLSFRVSRYNGALPATTFTSEFCGPHALRQPDDQPS